MTQHFWNSEKSLKTNVADDKGAIISKARLTCKSAGGGGASII